MEACVCYKDFFDSTYRLQDKAIEMEKLKKELILEDEETGEQVEMGVESDIEEEVEDGGSSSESYPSEEEYYPNAEYFYNMNFNNLTI